MKKLVVLFSILLFSAINAKAHLSPWNVEDSVIVGTQPLAIFSLNPEEQGPIGAYIVYCGGRDLDFNNVVDPGDEKPSLWLANIVYFLGEEAKPRAEKITDLDFGYSAYPFRPAFDNKEMFVSSNGKITRIHAELDGGDCTVIIDSICPSTAVAVSKYGDDLFLSEKPDYTNPGWVRVFRIGVGFVDSIPAGVNVQQTIMKENKLYILCEGVYGATESTIQVVENAESVFSTTDIIHLGISGSNHMSIVDNSLIVTNNFTNDVAVVDLTEKSVVRRIALSPDASPRESFVIAGSCLVSTFSGKVIQIDYESGEILDSSDVHGKAEGMYADMSALWVASPFHKGSYDYDSVVNVFIYLLDAEDSPNVKIASRPNPATDYVEITFPAHASIASQRISVANPMGEKIIDRALSNEEIINGTVQLSTQSLQMPNGVYFAEIQSGNSVYRCKFVVSR